MTFLIDRSPGARLTTSEASDEAEATSRSTVAARDQPISVGDERSAHV
jgi:hypothetical protein